MNRAGWRRPRPNRASGPERHESATERPSRPGAYTSIALGETVAGPLDAAGETVAGPRMRQDPRDGIGRLPTARPELQTGKTGVPGGQAGAPEVQTGTLGGKHEQEP